jgi:hypothetical protein
VHAGARRIERRIGEAVSDVKKYTPNSIANEIMAEDAWHDSLWVRAENYDALRTELAEARRDAEHWREARRSAIEAGDALMTELAEARRDAERYRWLRDEASYITTGSGNDPAELYYDGRCYRAPNLDAAIDAARKETP